MERPILVKQGKDAEYSVRNVLSGMSTGGMASKQRKPKYNKCKEEFKMNEVIVNIKNKQFKSKQILCINKS